MRNRLEYIPFITSATIIRLLPRKAAIGIGGWLGRMGRFFQPRRVRIATENLQKAFPELSSDQTRLTIEQMFCNLGKSFVDMLRLDQYCDIENPQTYFAITGQENIEQALAKKRGCIILTGHVGFWEAGTFFIPRMLKHPNGVVAKPMRNPLVDEYFCRMRTAAGSYIINSRKGARSILKALQQNHCICLLLDQHIKNQGSVAVPFFGRPAHTTTIITQMATRYRIPIVPGFVYRQPDETFNCEFGKAVILEGDLSEQNIRDNTALLNRIIEEAVRRNVNQWFWVHRRWRACCER